MAGQELEVQQKKEVAAQQEKTVPARFYVPPTDIFETAEALKIVMEVPGVLREAIDVKVENEVLNIEGRIETTNYNGLEPLYTEYPIGHFARSFSLPWQVDQQNITAHLEDGVLTLTLNKRPESKPRRIAIQ
ncbi:MAG: Hsp20/alpha crystallin family protein [Hyphomicrobiales bacterium]|nr:Hsp20/alpha crystallin family protein [Hyphomicrobiales bacterium]